MICFLASPASADPGAFALDDSLAVAADSGAVERRQSLEGLLLLPGGGAFDSRQETTDEALAAAVVLGNDPALERRKPFRKRNLDLFRTERPIVIGQNEMVLRLRLRAKTRKAMSIELHF